MIAIADYGACNLASVVKALRAAGGEPRVAAVASDLVNVAGIVVPGVGHFDATRRLGAPWRAAIAGAIARGVPLLGICLGMQWLYEGSDEAEGVDGLGLVGGRIFRLDGDVKVPHVGWNTLQLTRSTRLFDGLRDGEAMYFTHAYAAPVGSEAAAITTHGRPFAAVVERDNITGMQFHPEKSGAAGVRLLRNWIASCSASG